jgi:hypothetical protein
MVVAFPSLTLEFVDDKWFIFTLLYLLDDQE